MHAAGTRTVLVAIAMTLLVCVVAIGGSEPLRGTSREAAETAQRSPDVVVAPPAEFPVPGALPPEVFVFEEDSGAPGWLRWVIAPLLLAALAAVSVQLVRAWPSIGGLRRRRRRPGDPEPDERADEAAGAMSVDEDTDVARRAVEAALAPLRDPTDPRAAVIAAYARLEAVLAERELGRRRPEAPREYLARVLGQGDMPERSLTILTDMFEEARFSRHAIPESAPGRARGELERARAALATLDVSSQAGGRTRAARDTAGRSA
jgi:Domain of unknown function (DUF4129)